MPSDRLAHYQKVFAPVFTILAMGVLYLLTYPVLYSWESYLWAGAIEGWLSLVDLYRAIHPDRPPLPELVNLYHPNHPLMHFAVALLRIPAEWVGCCGALEIWRSLNTVSALVLLGMVYGLARHAGGSVSAAVSAMIFVGVGGTFWYEAIAADAHIAAAAASSVAIYLVFRLLDGTVHSRWMHVGFGLSAVVAVGLHLNSAVAFAFLASLLLWQRGRLRVAPQVVVCTTIVAATAILLLYVLPFLAHLLPVSWTSIRDTFLLNPAHGNPEIPGVWLFAVTGIGGLTRAIFPGYTSGAVVLQILAMAVLILPIVAALRLDRATLAMKRLLGLALVYQIWIAGMVQSPNTSNYWIHSVWLVQLVAILALFRVAPRMVASVTASLLILLAGASTYHFEIAPKQAMALDEVAFSLARVDGLRDYEHVVVGISDPHQMLVEAAVLEPQLASDVLAVVFTAAGPRFELPQTLRKPSVAVLVSSPADPLYRVFSEDPCYQQVFAHRRTEELPSSWFRFSTDWGFGRRATYSKGLWLAGFEYRPEGSNGMPCEHPIQLGLLNAPAAVAPQVP